MTIMNKIKVALADDHALVRNAIANLVTGYDGFETIFQANNGKELVDFVNTTARPEIVLLDINMPVMDGYDTCAWLKENYPDIKVLALSMYDKEHAIIRMLRNGAKGYILKDIDPREFKQALITLQQTGYYYSSIVSGKLIHAINNMDKTYETFQTVSNLNSREIEFLRLACTEMTYKEIAAQMGITPRTIDGYREGLFEKLDVHSRVGLVLFSIKNGIIAVD